MRFVLPLAVLAAASATAALSTAGSASAVSACGRAGYSYAGLQETSPARGVRTDLVALGDPHVESGHVAAWVGVGGPGQGAGGKDAWIQVGLASFHRAGSRLYYEVNRPGVGPRYTEIRAHVAPGSRHRVGVIELTRKPGWWRVWVNGKPVSAPMYLPGSHRRWRPVATAETWDGGRRVCNLFSYRFDRLAVARTNRGSWGRFVASYRFQDPGYRVVRKSRGFVARGVRPLPRGTLARNENPAPAAPAPAPVVAEPELAEPEG